MSVRSRLRRTLPYAISIIGGFLLAYIIVAFFVFPSGVIPRDIRVPNVTGLPFDDASRRLAERGLRGGRFSMLNSPSSGRICCNPTILNTVATRGRWSESSAVSMLR